MKKIFGWVALLVGMVTGANAQANVTCTPWGVTICR